MALGKGFLITLILLLAVLASRCPSDIQKPNIILIYADDLGYGDLQVMNDSSKIPTPNLNSLAMSGIRFTNAHSCSSVCSPSRYSILTGRYHWRGHLRKGIVQPWGDPVIEDGRKTLATLLSEVGYSTACIGKWHLGMTWPFRPGIGQNDSINEWQRSYLKDDQYFNFDDFDWDQNITKGPLTAGFDYYFGDGVINFPPYAWIENDKIITKPGHNLVMSNALPLEGNWGLSPGPASDEYDLMTAPIRLTERAVQWIEEQPRKKPFFLYFSLPSPHVPIIPTEAFTGKSMAGPYGDYVVQTDWMVGQIIEKLKEMGIDRKTLVIFTSDNGPERFAYDRVLNYQHRSMGPYRGVKRDLLEGGHRVPFIVSYPPLFSEGRVIDAPISQIDLTATLSELTGASIDSTTAEDSKSLLKAWRGKESEGYSHPVIHHTINGNFAIRKENWVLIMSNRPTISHIPPAYRSMENLQDEKAHVLLYNLDEDEQQLYNLAEEYPDIVKDLKNLLYSIQMGDKQPKPPAI